MHKDKTPIDTKNLNLPKLILASSSRYRQELLKRITGNFSSFSPNVDESPIDKNESPKDLVERLGKTKAQAAAQGIAQVQKVPHGIDNNLIVIGSDQVACLKGKILGKPLSYEKATLQLKAASGCEVIFYTSLCVYEPHTDTFYTHVDETKVIFQTLTDEKIEHYLRLEQPYDCAGSFKVEGLGICLFEKVINEDPTALMGLPLIKLCQILEQLKFPLGTTISY